MSMVNKHIKCFGKSLHNGQSGIVAADYGAILLVKADDASYSGAYSNSIGDGKYFQADTPLCKIIKD